jgi:hypothetical protein
VTVAVDQQLSEQTAATRWKRGCVGGRIARSGSGWSGTADSISDLSPGPDDLEAHGNLLDRDYAFPRGKKVVATVSKRWFAITDTNRVEIADSEYAVLILAGAVALDMICRAKARKEKPA